MNKIISLSFRVDPKSADHDKVMELLKKISQNEKPQVFKSVENPKSVLNYLNSVLRNNTNESCTKSSILDVVIDGKAYLAYVYHMQITEGNLLISGEIVYSCSEKTLSIEVRRGAINPNTIRSVGLYNEIADKFDENKIYVGVLLKSLLSSGIIADDCDMKLGKRYYSSSPKDFEIITNAFINKNSTFIPSLFIYVPDSVSNSVAGTKLMGYIEDFSYLMHTVIITKSSNEDILHSFIESHSYSAIPAYGGDSLIFSLYLPTTRMCRTVVVDVRNGGIEQSKEADYYSELIESIILLFFSYAQVNSNSSYKLLNDICISAENNNQYVPNDNRIVLMNTAISQRMQEERIRAGLSQDDLAGRLNLVNGGNITKIVISRLERGYTKKIRLGILRLIEKELNLEPDTFLGLEGNIISALVPKANIADVFLKTESDSETESDDVSVLDFSSDAIPRFCSSCGKPRSDGAKFCAYCGKQL